MIYKFFPLCFLISLSFASEGLKLEDISKEQILTTTPLSSIQDNLDQIFNVPTIIPKYSRIQISEPSLNHCAAKFPDKKSDDQNSRKRKYQDLMDTTDSNKTCGLLTLPNEIIVNIVQKLRLSDLSQFRLVSKQCDVTSATPNIWLDFVGKNPYIVYPSYSTKFILNASGVRIKSNFEVAHISLCGALKYMRKTFGREAEDTGTVASINIAENFLEIALQLGSYQSAYLLGLIRESKYSLTQQKDDEEKTYYWFDTAVKIGDKSAHDKLIQLLRSGNRDHYLSVLNNLYQGEKNGILKANCRIIYEGLDDIQSQDHFNEIVQLAYDENWDEAQGVIIGSLINKRFSYIDFSPDEIFLKLTEFADLGWLVAQERKYEALLNGFYGQDQQPEEDRLKQLKESADRGIELAQQYYLQAVIENRFNTSNTTELNSDDKLKTLHKYRQSGWTGANIWIADVISEKYYQNEYTKDEAVKQLHSLALEGTSDAKTHISRIINAKSNIDFDYKKYNTIIFNQYALVEELIRLVGTNKL